MLQRIYIYHTRNVLVLQLKVFLTANLLSKLDKKFNFGVLNTYELTRHILTSKWSKLDSSTLEYELLMTQLD